MSFLPKDVLRQKFALLAVAGMTYGFATTNGAASERIYFENVQGTWQGAGRIVAGPYKNTRFTCNLSGRQPTRVGMKLSGKCRVGLFTQPIEAVVAKSSGRYRGKFLDGAKGKGLDIISGRLRGKKLVLGIKRKKLVGTMVANLRDRNKLNITISVKVNGGLVPFIGLSLARTGGVKRAALSN